MVEEVYDETFRADLTEDELARRMDDDARYSMAEMAAVKAPQALTDLSTLTEKNVDEEKISTRLGADSVRVVCCFVDPYSRRWLNRERIRAVPETGVGKNGRFTVDQVKAVLGESIPLLRMTGAIKTAR